MSTINRMSLLLMKYRFQFILIPDKQDWRTFFSSFFAVDQWPKQIVNDSTHEEQDNNATKNFVSFPHNPTCTVVCFNTTSHEGLVNQHQALWLWEWEGQTQRWKLFVANAIIAWRPLSFLYPFNLCSSLQASLSLVSTVPSTFVWTG